MLQANPNFDSFLQSEFCPSACPKNRFESRVATSANSLELLITAALRIRSATPAFARLLARLTLAGRLITARICPHPFSVFLRLAIRPSLYMVFSRLPMQPQQSAEVMVTMHALKSERTDNCTVWRKIS
jgi:hypothetical protein